MRLTDQKELIRELSLKNGVSADLIERLLALEDAFPNLHAWGVRPELRRRMTALVDAEIEKLAFDDSEFGSREGTNV